MRMYPTTLIDWIEVGSVVLFFVAAMYGIV